MKRIQTSEKDLFKAILKLKDLDECSRFFMDLCTPAEIQAMTDRWRVARLLSKGIPYREIYEKTGVSTATVTRVARSLMRGENGYQILIDREGTKKAPAAGKIKTSRR
jgi:TrpR-related protein YerC/YecD